MTKEEFFKKWGGYIPKDMSPQQMSEMTKDMITIPIEKHLAKLKGIELPEDYGEEDCLIKLKITVVGE